MTFSLAASAGAATSDVADAVETAKQATRALDKAKRSAKNSAKELKSATVAAEQASTRLTEAEQLVVATEANLVRAREAVEEVSAQVDEAFLRTQELELSGGFVEVAAQAADVATGTSDMPVIDAVAGTVKAGLTGLIGPVLSLLDPISDAVNDEVAEADQQFAEAESREQALRHQEAEAAAAHRAASIEWTAAAAELVSAESALAKATKAEKKAAEQGAKDAKAVEKAKAAATKAEKKAAEQEMQQAAERAAAGRGEAAETASRSAVSGRVRPGTGSITSSYGMRSHPITGAYKLHSGTDFSYGDGNAYSAASGTVTSVEYDGAYGNMVTISHGGGTETRYAHLAGASVSSGQKVSAGQVVGKIGSTGYATGPHLHFEVLIGDDFVNPEGWLSG